LPFVRVVNCNIEKRRNDDQEQEKSRSIPRKVEITPVPHREGRIGALVCVDVCWRRPAICEGYSALEARVGRAAEPADPAVVNGAEARGRYCGRYSTNNTYTILQHILQMQYLGIYYVYIISLSTASTQHRPTHSSCR
jgi:hypothetical protein